MASSVRFLMIIFVCILQHSCDGFDPPLGTCWKLRYKGKSNCGRPVRTAVTRQRCCRGNHDRSWNTFLPPNIFNSSSSLDRRSAVKNWISNNRNHLTNHAGQPECEPCSNSCRNVKCDEDEKCIMRKGLPKCVCNPKCHLQHKATVCGTDGKTYASECHLLKRSCRKKIKLLVAHSGNCQTCTDVNCGKKVCVLDEHLKPKCMRCSYSCPQNSTRKPFCATDEVTYASKCHLKMASCAAGSTIKRAYRGPCTEIAACENIRCWRGEKCLTELMTGQPRCWRCGNLHQCLSTPQTVCAADGRTFHSWCAFRMQACRTRNAMEAVPLHQCSKHKKKPWMDEKKCKSSDSPSKDANGLRNINSKKGVEFNANNPLKFRGNMHARTKGRKNSSRKNWKEKKRNRRRKKRKRDEKRKGCKSKRQRKNDFVSPRSMKKSPAE